MFERRVARPGAPETLTLSDVLLLAILGCVVYLIVQLT